MSWLINASQLDKLRKNQKQVIILDASWHLPSIGRQAKEEFLQGHILGARFLDLDVFHDKESSLPNMLLRNEKKISEEMSRLGITNEHKIIFYDNSELYTSCRALWMFKVFGHSSNQLYILNGGYDAWKKYGGKIETVFPKSSINKTYLVDFQSHLVRTLVQMKTNLHYPSEQVIDLRHAVRFSGGDEHRVGLRKGHIPGSFCFPYMTMFERDGSWKSIEKIRKQLFNLGVDFNVPIITTCGSAITAAMLNFVLDLMGETAHSVYDGSWCEWGAENLYPGEVSLDERPIATVFD